VFCEGVILLISLNQCDWIVTWIREYYIGYRQSQPKPRGTLFTPTFLMR
jgi:hypothetical protein